MRGGAIAAAAAVVFVAAGSAGRAAPAERPAAEAIVEQNVAARGGLAAWRKIQSMVWVGQLQSTHAPLPSMVFMMLQKRPNKTRFEINAVGDKTVRVFDGTRGWKLKPNRAGVPELKPYSSQEVSFARAAQVIDGPLIDYFAKGNTVTLEGLDEIEGHKAFRLGVRLAGGETDHIWVDTKTFLEIRYDRPTAGASGHDTVSVFYRNYKNTDGLQIPSIIETASGPGQTPDKMVIEKVILNPPAEDRAFARPGGGGLSNTAAAMGAPPGP